MQALERVTLRLLPKEDHPRAIEADLFGEGADALEMFEYLVVRCPPRRWVTLPISRLRSVTADPCTALQVLARKGYLETATGERARPEEDCVEIEVVCRPMTIDTWWREVMSEDAYVIYRRLTREHRWKVVGLSDLRIWLEERGERPEPVTEDTILKALRELQQARFITVEYLRGMGG